MLQGAPDRGRHGVLGGDRGAGCIEFAAQPPPLVFEVAQLAPRRFNLTAVAVGHEVNDPLLPHLDAPRRTGGGPALLR